jgi:hypothetical protein
LGPGVAARKIHDHVDAALIPAENTGAAELPLTFPDPIRIGVIDPDIRAERIEPLQLLVA